jgi:hypothetical protein
MKTLEISSTFQPALDRYNMARKMGMLQFPSPAVEDGRWVDKMFCQGPTVFLAPIESATLVEDALAKINLWAFPIGLAALVEIAMNRLSDPAISIVGLATTFTHNRLKGDDLYSPMLMTGGGGRGIGVFRWRAKLQPGMFVASVMLA